MKLGSHHSEESKKKISEALIGNRNPAFKGVRYFNGYRNLYRPKHPHSNIAKCVAEHTLVMEEYLGRYLTKKERVHHINYNRLDNRIENLYLCKSSSFHIATTHKSFNDISKELFMEEFNKGKIIFDKKEGIYRRLK